MLPVERLGQDVSGLVQTGEYQVIESTAASLFDTSSDAQLEFLGELEQAVNVQLVRLVLEH